VELVGAARADELKALTLALYGRAAEITEDAGILLADTKFEFGLDGDGGLVLADEVLTPDSSRFWPASSWAPGGAQPSFDKQYVRDWLTGSGWDRASPPPELPDDVVAATRDRYVTAYEQLTRSPFH
jgi:phosphoribosylaminoimidazole-succinocarboxamide synthase